VEEQREPWYLRRGGAGPRLLSRKWAKGRGRHPKKTQGRMRTRQLIGYSRRVFKHWRDKKKRKKALNGEEKIRRKTGKNISQ